MSSDQTGHKPNEIIVEMADMKVSNDPEVRLKSTTLGSGVAVLVYDPEVHVVGLLHFLLPKWDIGKKFALDNPSIFGNSGIPQLYKRCYKLGAEKERMKCFLIGGADLLKGSDEFCPGEDNLRAARELMEKNKVTVDGEWAGGLESRVVRFNGVGGRLLVQTVKGDELCNIQMNNGSGD